MIKKSFPGLSLFLLMFLTTNVQAQCNIVWWGPESGSVPTDETSVTEAATYEAFIAIFGFAPGDCSIITLPIPELSDLGYACTDGKPVGDGSDIMLYTVSLDLKCWDSGIFDFSCDNEWDVVCGPCGESGGDLDADGVCDDYDECEDTPADVIVDPSNGCSIEQLVPCDGDWKNHGKYVSALSKTAKSFVAQGLITMKEKKELMKEMATSDCGK